MDRPADWLEFETLRETWGEYHITDDNIILKGRSSLAIARKAVGTGKDGLTVRVHHAFVAVDSTQPVSSESLQTEPAAPVAAGVKIDIKRAVRIGSGLIEIERHEGVFRLTDGTLVVIRMTPSEVRVLAGRNANGDPMIQVDHTADILVAPQFLMEDIAQGSRQTSLPSTTRP